MFNKIGFFRFLSLLLTLVCSGNLYAAISSNIGVTSNYIWRGQTQTSDNAAVSGGVDYANDSGFAAGVWVSNVDFTGDDAGNETDFYASYSTAWGDLGVSIGGIYYMYTEHDDSDFAEATLDFNYQQFSLGMAYVLDSDFNSEDDLYYYAGVSIPLPREFEASLTVGIIDPDKGESGNYWQIDISKDEFTLSVVRASDELDSKEDTKVFVSWNKSF